MFRFIETARKLGLSIGEALWEPGEDPPEIEALLRFADREMYREEEAKKKVPGRPGASEKMQQQCRKCGIM